MDINERFKTIIQTLYNGNKRAFAKAVDVSPTVIENVVGTRNGKPSYDVLVKVCANANISTRWLLTGEGEMLRSQTTDEANQSHDQHDHEDAPPSSTTNPLKHGVNPNRSFEHLINPPNEPNRIPLVSVQAVGGFAGKDFAIHKHDIEAYYVIPKFRNLNVDFLIEVVGDSMMPRIFPGDIVACSIIRNPQFIQWNKTYLISSEEQGMIVKRLKKSNEKDCYLAVSDNLEYDPFDIPKSDIRGIARVVGVIHAE